MQTLEKFAQVASFLRASRTPIPFILDMLRLKGKDYTAECQGIQFELSAGRYEWFTVLENAIREDYFSNGIVLSKGQTVVDIGANFGSFSLVASKRVGAEGRVIAFEPNPAIFNQLMRNVELNELANVVAFNEAVGGIERDVELFIHHRSAFSTLVSTVDSRPNTNAASVSIRARAINAIIEEIPGGIDLLKMDCEGSEYEIVDNLSASAASRVRQISMEVHTVKGRQATDIGARLVELGFLVNATLPKLTAVRSPIVNGAGDQPFEAGDLPVSSRWRATTSQQTQPQNSGD